MLASLTEPHIWTANLLVIGLVQGLCLPFRGFSRSSPRGKPPLLDGAYG